MDFLIGIVVGASLCYVFGLRKRVSGLFVMDFTDPLKDVCRIELFEDLNSLYSRKHIWLRVDVHEDNSLN